jgi:hypothetical protein
LGQCGPARGNDVKGDGNHAAILGRSAAIVPVRKLPEFR